MNLSRRKFFVGLMATAALTPVARVVEVTAERDADDMAFLEGFSQELGTTIFYGDAAEMPTRFSGFTPFVDIVCSKSISSQAWRDFNCGGIEMRDHGIRLVFPNDPSVLPYVDRMAV